MMKRDDEQTCLNSLHSLLPKTALHSVILVPSLWRVFPLPITSQIVIPSLTIVVLDKERAFKYRKTIHAKSTSSPSFSFLDITSALQQYLQFIVSSTRNSSPHYSQFLLQRAFYHNYQHSNSLHNSEIAAFHSHQTNGTPSLFRTLNLYPIRNTQIQRLSPLSLPRRLYETNFTHHHKDRTRRESQSIVFTTPSKRFCNPSPHYLSIFGSRFVLLGVFTLFLAYANATYGQTIQAD